MIRFEHKFIKQLNKHYPEKIVALMGIEFSWIAFESYINDYDINVHAFDINAFNRYLKSINQSQMHHTWVGSTMPTQPKTGELFFDTSSNNMMVFDGSKWLTVNAMPSYITP